MFFRTPRFIRRWIRRRMHPMAEDRAWSIREKLSVVYMICAWNAFGFVMYQLYQGNKHWPVTYGLKSKEEEELSRPAYQWASVLGIKKAQVYRLDKNGLSEADVIDLEAGEEEKPALST